MVNQGLKVYENIQCTWSVQLSNYISVKIYISDERIISSSQETGPISTAYATFGLKTTYTSLIKAIFFTYVLTLSSHTASCFPIRDIQLSLSDSFQI